MTGLAKATRRTIRACPSWTPTRGIHPKASWSRLADTSTEQRRYVGEVSEERRETPDIGPTFASVMPTASPSQQVGGLNYPCEQEQERLRRARVSRVRWTKGIVLEFWILVPLAILLLEFASPIAGVAAFVLSLVTLGVEFAKLFGDPGRGIPGHKGTGAPATELRVALRPKPGRIRG